MVMNAKLRPECDENAFDDKRLAMPPMMMMMLVDPKGKMRDSEPARCCQP